jgi:hypothetical protein
MLRVRKENNGRLLLFRLVILEVLAIIGAKLSIYYKIYKLKRTFATFKKTLDTITLIPAFIGCLDDQKTDCHRNGMNVCGMIRRKMMS